MANNKMIPPKVCLKGSYQRTFNLFTKYITGVKVFGSPPYEDDTIDYFGDLEGANVDEFSYSPRVREGRKMIREDSNVSEASLNISSTPEAESYFKRKTILLEEKALRGELDISVPEPEAPATDLQVLPLENISEEIEIFNLSEEPVLTVKDAMSSSFENLYDRCSEANQTDLPRNSSQRGSFHATFNVPERVSSFENLYEPGSASSASSQQHLFGAGYHLIK